MAAYRKPDFRVDANVDSADDLAGATLKGDGHRAVPLRRRHGGTAREGAPTRKEALESVPKAVEDRFDPGTLCLPGRGLVADRSTAWEQIFQKDMILDGEGVLSLDLPTDLKAGGPIGYTLEGEVTDVSRQTIAGRASFPVHPAPWYLGLKRPGYFVDAEGGRRDRSGGGHAPTASRRPASKVTVSLVQVQWNSVRTRRGRRDVHLGEQARGEGALEGEVTTAAGPVPVKIPIAQGGYYVLRSTASDAEGRTTTTDTDFYCPRPRLHGLASATTTTASTSCPRRRPTSPGRPRAS